MTPACKRSVPHGRQRSPISSCKLAARLQLCLPGFAGACIRPDAHGYSRIRMDFRNTASRGIATIEPRALIWRAGDLPVGEQISLWRALGFAVAFGVSRHVEVGLAWDMLGYASSH